MKKAKRILSGMLVAVMAAALLAGCGSADSGAAASGQHYNLAYQCAWGSGGGPYQYASDLSKAIVEASGGRVTMECLATNSIVPTTEMLQAVSNGTLDCAQTAATNFSDDSLGILSTLPVGMTFDEYMGWYIAGEGQQVLDEVMAQIDSNVVAFPCGIVDSEILYHSTKPIKCLDDIKGLKIRGVSDWANIETRLGASVVTMDGGDCYEALSHGTIDAAEYSSPSANWAAGFQEVAPYLTVPGVHQSCSVYLFLINRNIWDGLDAQTQSIIKLACTSMMAQNWAEDRAANGKAWEQFRELEAQGKLTIYRMPDEDLDKIRRSRRNITRKSARQTRSLRRSTDRSRRTSPPSATGARRPRQNKRSTAAAHRSTVCRPLGREGSKHGQIFRAEHARRLRRQVHCVCK